MADELHVIKTLVIGMGTSGTNVCLGVAQRVAWEYGSIARAPWIRFLCIETDSNTSHSPLPDEAMINLGITATEFEQVLKFEPAYDQFMDLSLWADPEVLRKVPHAEVATGAGNIRMVGRLALLFPRNYKVVRNSIEDNLRKLHLLDGSAAQEALGKLADGSEPTITFGAGGGVRIFVVGSLCGGTCSGLASDIGFVVGSIKRPEDKTLAIFSLPQPSLSDKSQPQAERFKVNAYAALTELNHYHLPHLEKPPIKAGSETIVTTGALPYDATFIVMPDATGAEAVERLTIAMADRVFLNSSVPAVDPFGKLADATFTDREGHAHVFCTFGMSSIEFPRQRVIEGCTKQLLLSALRLWDKPDTTGELKASAETAVRGAGLRADTLSAALRKTDKGQDIPTVLEDLVGRIDRSQTRSQIRETVTYLRAVLGTQPGVPALEAGVRPMDVPNWIAAHVTTVATQCADNIRRAIDQCLLQPQGLRRARAILDAAEEALTKLSQMKPVDLQADRTASDQAVESVPERRPCWPPSRRRYAEAVERAKRAVREEISNTLDALTRSAICGAGPRLGDGTTVVGQCRQMLKPVRVRLDHLRVRVTHLVTKLDASVQTLTKRQPTMNGEAIFSTGAWEGTIGFWYKRELGALAGDDTLWEKAQTAESAAVIAEWSDLPRFLRSGADPDWLADDVDPDAPELIPSVAYERLLDRALQPFARLRRRSVADELANLSNMRDLVNRGCSRTRELVYVDDALATEGGRSPVSQRVLMLCPAGTDGNVRDTARAAIQGNLEVVESPDTSRIVLLRECYRFPLYGAPQVVSSSGSLAQAECHDFKTFFSRKDVYWTGLSKAEHEAQLRAEEILVVAILLESVTLEHGKIVCRVMPTKLGDPSEIELPFSIAEASRVLNPQQPGRRASQTDWGLLQQLEDKVKSSQAQMSPEEFVRYIKRAYEESGLGHALRDWASVAGVAFRRYCGRDEKLYKAYRLVFPPSEERIQRMLRKAGMPRPTGGTFPKDGLYCLDNTCCGWIGSDERDAAMNGWKCFICGADCYPA